MWAEGVRNKVVRRSQGTEVLRAGTETTSEKGRLTPGDEKVGMKEESVPVENSIFLKENNGSLLTL